MADNVWDNVGGVANDGNDAANWSLGWVPIAGDNMRFTGNVGNCTFSGNIDPTDGFQVDNAFTDTIDINGNLLDINGVVDIGTGVTIIDSGIGEIECNGNFTTNVALPDGLTVTLNGTGNVSANVAGNRPDLVINTAGTHTAIDAAFWDTFTMTAGGTYNPNTQVHTIAGNMTWTAGAVTVTGSWIMSASGTLTWSDWTNRLNSFHVNTGVTCTIGTTVKMKKLTTDAGSALSGVGEVFQIDTPGANDMIDIQGTNTAKILLYESTAARSNSGKIVAGTFRFYCVDSKALTQTGVVEVDNLEVYSNTNGSVATTNLNITGNALGAVTLGDTATTKGGKLDLGNGGYASTMTSLVKAGTGTCTLDFGDSIITLSGTINGTDITCTTNNDNYTIVRGGTISNVTISSGRGIDATDNVVDGGGNGPKVYFRKGTTISSISMGGYNLAVDFRVENSNNCPALLISYGSQLVEVSNNPTKACVLGGLPLSVSLYASDNPSGTNIVNYYTFNIIENFKDEDTIDLNTAQLPSARSFMFFSTRLNAAKINSLYYFKISDTLETALPTNSIVLNGIPMATGRQNELILHRSEYTMNDLIPDPSSNVVNLIEFNLGGTPLQAGRVGNKYYLIVSPAR